MITKGQLIKLLQDLPVNDDTPVVTPGFDESNYDDIDVPRRPNLLTLTQGEHLP